MSRNLQQLLSLAICEISKRKQFITYAIIGVSGATLDFAAFILMVKFIPVHYLLINACSTTLGITNNFILNARFNFGVKDRMIQRFLSFFAVGLLGMATGSAILYLLVDIMKVLPELSKLIVIFVIVFLQYSLNKRFSFGNSQTYTIS